MYLKNNGPYNPFDDTVLQELDASYLRWRRIDQQVDRFILILLLVLAALAVALFLDSRQTPARIPVGTDPRDFGSLLAVNPDTVAWLHIDDTPIDDPVVQGKDNFEYLDKGFDGAFDAGGTLFLDAANTQDLSDRYSIIHGHHMAGNEMFGCLEKYLDAAWFREHRTGDLRTPEHEFDLNLIAAGIYDAYDSEVYAPGEHQPLGAIGRSRHKIGTEDSRLREHGSGAGASRILALSTCAGDMSDDRIVVFWRMTERREHNRMRENNAE